MLDTIENYDLWRFAAPPEQESREYCAQCEEPIEHGEFMYVVGRHVYCRACVESAREVCP